MNSTLEALFFPVALVGIVALLLASVGQAVATGYIAVMELIGFGPDVIKPIVHALNVLVAAIGSIRFANAVLLTWRSCFPMAS
jgi:hypothetical protein